LASLVVRGLLETATVIAPSQTDTAAYKELAHRLSHWLNEQNFTSSFTLDELAALSIPAGSWDSAQHDRHAEWVEALGVLFWALSLHETLPSWMERFPVPDLQPALGWPAEGLASPRQPALAHFPYDGTDLLTGLVQLRPPAIVGVQRAAAECWQWRCQVAALERSDTSSATDYRQMVGIAAEEAFSAGAIARPVASDFPIGNKPFFRLGAEEEAQCASITAARRIALDWLCGYATPWDVVPVATAAA
jgi:hypothetical protein